MTPGGSGFFFASFYSCARSRAAANFLLQYSGLQSLLLSWLSMASLASWICCQWVTFQAQQMLWTVSWHKQTLSGTCFSFCISYAYIFLQNLRKLLFFQSLTASRILIVSYFSCSNYQLTLSHPNSFITLSLSLPSLLYSLGNSLENFSASALNLFQTSSQVCLIFVMTSDYFCLKYVSASSSILLTRSRKQWICILLIQKASS